MTLNQTLGAAVQAARKARGWTQTQLAEQSGVHLNTVSAIERGQADPRLSSLSALLAPLGMQLQALPVEWLGAVQAAAFEPTPSAPASGKLGAQSTHDGFAMPAFLQPPATPAS